MACLLILIILGIINLPATLSVKNINHTAGLLEKSRDISVVAGNLTTLFPKWNNLPSLNNSKAFFQVTNLHSNRPKISNQIYSRRKIDQCWIEAKCEPLEDATCLGVKLPYSHTSLALSKLPSQLVSREILESLTALRNIPYCWSVVQPFLCAVLFPQCNDSSVQLPSIEMCSITRGPCRLFEKVKGWPEYLLCRKEFPHKCKTASRDLAFNETGVCMPPLVNTSSERTFVEGFKGCGLQCSDPLFALEEHEELQNFISVFGGISLFFSAFTVLTYLIDWRCASKYPALIIFYINVCFLITITFMSQLYKDFRRSITCNSDNTLRSKESSSGGNLSCMVIFACIYYFMIAAAMWFVILGYAWRKTFKSLAVGQCQQSLERKASYFHLISWSIPLVFTIGVIASSAVEADSTYGICFLSSDWPTRFGALLLPVSVAVVVGVGFLSIGLKSLVKMKMECSNIISENANKKVVETIVRLTIFIVSLSAFLLITIYCHFYTFLRQDAWKESLWKYILCTSGLQTGSSACALSSRPNLNVHKLNLLALFGSGVLMSSWCWTKNTLRAWQRFLRRVVGVVDDEPAKLTKHKIIAEAFAKRNDLNNVGRLSISLRSVHSDPVGLHFEMNSASSGDFSSVWAAAIPYLMNRRGAVSGSTAFAFRRNSVDSDFSINRRLSIESVTRSCQRRHSLDSQLSFHVSDVERFAAYQTAAKFGGRRRYRRERFSLLRSRARAKSTFKDRRNSTSDDSNMGSVILPCVNLSTTDSLFTTMMKRLNLSSDYSTDQHCKDAAVDQRNLGVIMNSNPSINRPEDSKNFGNNSMFSRKLNVGIWRKDKNISEIASNKSKDKVPKKFDNKFKSNEIVKASVGIQTSLESLNSRHQQPISFDKSCQVSSPLLNSRLPAFSHESRNYWTATPSSTSDSLISSNGRQDVDNAVVGTGLIIPSGLRESSVKYESFKAKSRRSLSPSSIARSLRCKNKLAHSFKKMKKKRCWSENEKADGNVDIEMQ